MTGKFCRCFIAAAFVVSALTPAGAEGKQSQIESTMNSAQKAFDSRSFVRAERYWQRALSEVNKSGAPDETTAKLLGQLGDCSVQQGKLAKAQDFYKQALQVVEKLALDPTAIQTKLKDLAAVYRPINLSGFDEHATSFAQQVGAESAGAWNKDEIHHIDINLKKRFQQGIKELIDSVPSGLAGKPDEQSQQAFDPSASSEGAPPPVKQIRLDKLIAFDLRRGEQDGKIRVANIQGIFLNVGLWVKVKDFVMIVENSSPFVEVTAGAFGVDKKVKVALPNKLFARLREGLDKFDPFLADSPKGLTGETKSAPQDNSAACEPSVPGKSSQSKTPSAITPEANNPSPGSSEMPAPPESLLR